MYHPDIAKFINAKTEEGKIANANMSVTVDDAFMKAVVADDEYWTRFKGKKYAKYRARDIFEMIVEGMWKNGEPGILFYNRINDSPYKFIGEELTATNPSLRKGTKVITDLGIFPIEELEGKSFKVINLDGNLSDAECFLSGKNKPLYKVNLSGGISYYATEEHKWAVAHGKKDYTFSKKTTLELSKGDRLPISTFSKPIFGELGTYSDGFFSGWLCGDGWITNRGDNHKTQVGVIVSEKDAKNGIKDILEEKFNEIGVSTTFPFRKPDNREGWYEINTVNNKLNIFLEKFGIEKKQYGIPKKIWNECSEEFIYGFIDGLISSDGNISSGKVTITTAHEKFANDIIELLGIMGIPANLKKSNSKISDRDNVYIRYDICFPSSLLIGKIVLSNVYKQKSIEENITERTKKNYFRKVLSVEKTDLNEDVWDIRVYDDTHCFALPNVITGNCSEQPLSPNGSCNLGSLDLSKFLDNNGEFNWGEFEIAIRYGMRFLDAVIDKGQFPTPEIAKWAEEHRAVGLGIMGYADLLLMKEIAYGSPEAIQILEDVLSFMDKISVDESEIMGKELGVPEKCKLLPVPRRNITTTTIAPTGTVSIIAGASSGIEPIFSEITVRNDKTGTYTFENDLASKPYFRCAVSSNGATEVTWEEHIETLAAAQRHIQSGVSKTINFPNNAKRESIANAVMMAWQKGCKGVAVYRNGSRKVEVLSPQNIKKDKCPVCGNDMVEINGEKRCIFCKKEIEGTASYYD